MAKRLRCGRATTQEAQKLHPAEGYHAMSVSQRQPMAEMLGDAFLDRNIVVGQQNSEPQQNQCSEHAAEWAGSCSTHWLMRWHRKRASCFEPPPCARSSAQQKVVQRVPPPPPTHTTCCDGHSCYPPERTPNGVDSTPTRRVPTTHSPASLFLLTLCRSSFCPTPH